MSRKKLCLILVVIFALNIVLILAVSNADAVTYKRGSTGEIVTKIQQVLKNQGFYTGTADGIYGRLTEAAVKAFQQGYGLSVDGKAGPKTLQAMGIQDQGGGQTASSSGSGDTALLARLISAEARGETYNGQVAVGAVVLNRVEHPSFPNSLSGVVYQGGAFTCITDGQFDEPVAESAYRAAQDAFNGNDPSGGAIYYFNPATATSSWIWSRPLIVTIGKHRFCS